MIPVYPGRVVPLEIFVARKFGIGFLGGYILVQGIFFFWEVGGEGGGGFPLQVYKGLFRKPLNRDVTGWQGALL